MLPSDLDANGEISDPGITKNLDRMNAAGEQIFKVLGKEPGKVTLVRRFMSYYLPTAEKLMEQYRELSGTQVKGENITSAMKRIESSVSMIADAFDKCADNLYKDNEMDIDAEIQVMKTMLTGDSLLENAVNDIRSVQRAATPEEKPEDGAREIKLTLGGH